MTVMLQGRMDLKARCIQTALFYSYGVRKDSTVTLLDAESARSLAVLGSAAETMRPDERRIGELMQVRSSRGYPPPRCCLPPIHMLLFASYSYATAITTLLLFICYSYYYAPITTLLLLQCCC